MSESKCFSVACADLIQINLGTAILAWRVIGHARANAWRDIIESFLAAIALSGVLILLDLQVVCCRSQTYLLPDIVKRHCLLISNS